MGHHHHGHHHHHHHHHYSHYQHTYQPPTTSVPGPLADLLQVLQSPAASVYDGLPPMVDHRPAVQRAIRAQHEAQRALLVRITQMRGVHRAALRGVDWPAHAGVPNGVLQDLATRVLAGDGLAYREALAACRSLEEVHSHVGKDGVQVALDAKHAHVDLRAPLGDVVPKENGTLIKTSDERLDLYQDYVCGIALRAARELLAALPLDEVTVDLWNVSAEPEETAGGGAYREAEKQPTNVRIASMRCGRAVMESIAWPTADASEVVGVLAHEMDFRAGEGFYAVPHIMRD